MTIKEFLNALEGYFGEYPRPMIKVMLNEYLKSYKEDDLDIIYKNLLFSFSPHTKTPGIYEIEKIKNEIESYTGEKLGCGLSYIALSGQKLSDGEKRRLGIRIENELQRK